MNEKNKKKKKELAVNQAEEGQRQPTNEEQMRIRQSAPMPTADEEAKRMALREQQQRMLMQGQGVAPYGAVNGFKMLE